MKQHALLRIAVVACAVVLTASACGDNSKDGDTSVKILGTDGNMYNGFGANFSGQDGALAGMRGTLPLTNLSKDFQDRLRGLDPDIKDFIFAGESYDAVIVSALASEIARSNSGTEIAKYINGVTTKGEKCTTYRDCLTLINENKDIDYDGVSGPLEFSDPGEPTVASFGIQQFGKNNQIDTSATKYLVVGDPQNATKQEITAPPRSTPVTDGPLKIGTLAPLTGPLSVGGPPVTKGTTLAKDDINEAGGVNGQPVELTQGDDGTNNDIAGQVADRHLQAGVSVIIGASGSGTSKHVMDRVTSAGVVLFSSSNTSDELTTINDNGLYFRTSPPDVLQARPLAKIMLDESAERVGIVAQNTPYGTGLANNVKNNLIEGGVPEGNIVVKFYDPAARDFSAEAQSMKDHDPDFILVVGYDESAGLVKKLNEKGVGPQQ